MLCDRCYVIYGVTKSTALPTDGSKLTKHLRMYIHLRWLFWNFLVNVFCYSSIHTLRSDRLGRFNIKETCTDCHVVSAYVFHWKALYQTYFRPHIWFFPWSHSSSSITLVSFYCSYAVYAFEINHSFPFHFFIFWCVLASPLTGFKNQ